MIIYILITKTRHLIGTMQDQVSVPELTKYVITKHNEIIDDLENDIKLEEYWISVNDQRYKYDKVNLEITKQKTTHKHKKNMADQEYNRFSAALEPPVNTVVKYTDDQWDEWLKYIVDEYNKEMTELKRIGHLREREYSDRDCELKNNKDELERTMYRLKKEHNTFMFQLKCAMSDLKRAEEKGP